MEYDERSGLKKGFDSVFKQNYSFKSKDDEIKRQEEVALKQKQMEEEAQRKKEEFDSGKGHSMADQYDTRGGKAGGRCAEKLF